MTLEKKVPVLGWHSVWMLDNNQVEESLFLRLLSLVNKKLNSENTAFVLSSQVFLTAMCTGNICVSLLPNKIIKIY